MMRNRPFPSTLLLIAIAVLAVGLGSTALWIRGPGENRVDPVPFAMAVALVCLATTGNLAVRWLRWQFLLRTFSIRLRARESLALFFGMLPMIMTPWACGEILLFPALRRHTAKPLAGAVKLWLTSRAADAGALLLLGIFWSAWFLPLALLFFAVAVFALEPVERRGRLLPQATRLALFLGLSIAAWLLAAAGMYASVAALGGGLRLEDGVRAFTHGTLAGSILGLPGGVVVAGGRMIELLSAAGVTPGTAVWSVLAVRIGTTGFSLLTGISVLILRRRTLAALFRGQGVINQGHFEGLADDYANQIPTHVRDRLVETKSKVLLRALERAAAPAGASGLDIGCGQGWYAARLAREGFHMHGCDPAEGQVLLARSFCAAAGVNAEFRTCGAEHLDFPSGHFDFAFSINVFHHIVDPVIRERAFAEAVRVLKPGAPLFLFEMNTVNPLFRLYMSYLFPLLRDIDDGTERWLIPGQLPTIPGAHWDPEVEYITFTPDFIPRALLKPAALLEERLERSCLRRYSAHLMITLRKDP